MSYEKQYINVHYYVNKDNKRLYKLVDNKKAFMWYKSQLQWGNCCTSAREVLDGYYNDVYMKIQEDRVKNYK